MGLGLLSLSSNANTFSDQAQQLAELRAEVATLAQDISIDLASFDARSRSLETQKSDLELQLRRENAQLESVDEALNELMVELEPEAQDAALEMVVHQMGAQLKSSISSSLPYRHADRLKAVDDILNALTAQELSGHQAATRLWAVAEDERRLNRENILDKQSIERSGETLLVDVARLGMMVMYYQTPTGEIGYAHRSDTEWIWTPITDPDLIKSTQLLFTNLGKGIRTGTFSLPQLIQQP